MLQTTLFNAFVTFFWQTVNYTKIEIFTVALDSFLEHFVDRIADKSSQSPETWHDNVK